MEFDNNQTEFTPQQINGLLSSAMLQSGGYDRSSRRERIAAQFIAAMISSGHYESIGHQRWNDVSDNLVECAISLTDKLIIRLETDKYFPNPPEEPPTVGLSESPQMDDDKKIIPVDINPCTFCSNIEDTATTRYLVSRSDLPNEIKAKLLNHIESWLPEYQSQLHPSLHKALMSMELRGNNLLRSLLYEEAIKRGFDPKHITVCGRVYHRD